MDRMLTTTLTTAAVTELPPVESPGPPVESPGPASADTESAQTSNAQNAKRLIEVSPLLAVTGRGGYATRIPHDTPVCVERLVLFRARLSDGQYDAAANQARELADNARTDAERVCWLKDLAFVKRAVGDFLGSYDLHLSLVIPAAQFTGGFRARIEMGFARSLETLYYTDRALDRFTEARWHAEGAGDLWTCANIDLDTGRCLTRVSRPADAFTYLDRAALIAKQLNETHLFGQIVESRALAYEARERYDAAEADAWAAIQILTATGDKTATEEAFRTWRRVKALAEVEG